jgi:HSP20 family protein
MADAAKKLPVATEPKPTEAAANDRGWMTLEGLRREIDRLFDDMNKGWHLPSWRSSFGADRFFPLQSAFSLAPATDFVEKPESYEISVELPGLDQKDIDVAFADGTLVIKGEKKEEREEKEKGRYLTERRYGAFQRSFRVPDGVDPDKVAATFAKGILTVTLPKTPEAQKPERKIAVKAA